ncbi:MAG: hypothetical protein AAF696_14280 [Bacteroidota bacterium]
MRKFLLSICIFYFHLATMSQVDSTFIFIEDGNFKLKGKPYYFVGTNFWYGMNLGSKGKGGDRERLLRELDHLQSLGVNNLRIMAASEGPDDAPWRMLPSLQRAPGEYNEDVLEGLDFLLVEMAKRDMYAVLCLNNFWPWSGGMSQYKAWVQDSEIPYPPPAENGSWVSYQTYTSDFYTIEKALALFEDHVRFIVGRINGISGQAYRDDPHIMAWQLANEPRGILKVRKYRKWIKSTAELIKTIDQNHLLTIGSEGYTPSKLAGTHARKDHKFKSIDYLTLHIWIQNWGWYDPNDHEKTFPKAKEKAMKYLERHIEAADKLEKPLVMEEFGIARDEDEHNPAAPTEARNSYYQFMFEELYKHAKAGSKWVGCNFWAWGGEGRPREPHAVWKAGDDFIGDPPHEYQGWYSIYDTDHTTLEIIKNYNKKLKDLGGE